MPPTTVSPPVLPADAGPIDATVAARLRTRRALRMNGRGAPSGGLIETDTVAAGPDLIPPRTPLPDRPAKADPIRQRLMDAAEFLFARWSYTGVSIRDISDLAGMRIANVSYYFGSKQNLYLEVLRRRATVIAAERYERIAAVERADLPATDFVRALVDAYVDPSLERSLTGDPGWKSYFMLIGNMTFSRLWPVEVAEHYNGPTERLAEAVGKRFPQVPAFEIQALSLLMIAPMLYTLAETGRVEAMSNPAFGSNEIDVLGPATKDFIVGGFRHILAKFMPL